ncbi:PrsW family intramembrane metalloprotease [Flaviflexus huanghaiensis]|uniref:PrsW family intramembrane metalloprotease n=1 Tax=Flaviflexus huanghaiensis TaxID=1111473 RepID=UPI0015FE4BE6|nr:PrsW family intramembrane metalloprotease [Flaviflexus huanghaiensis]
MDWQRAQERPWVPAPNPRGVPGPVPYRLPRRHSVGFYMTVAVLALVGVAGFIVVLPLLTESAGTGAAARSGIIALIPVIVVTAIIWWVDSWEPEPRWIMIAMFLWGGGVAVALAAWINTAWAESYYFATGNAAKASMWAAVVSAPIVEEAAKGLGVVLVFVFFRKYVNGPLDGLAYGAMSGLGFAFTENILYFTRYFEYLGEIAILRFSSPLLHPLCTAIIGMFLGFAVYARSRWVAVPLLVPGYALAVAIHFMHNGWATIADSQPDGSMSFNYLAVQIPSYLAAVILVVWFRHEESLTISQRLDEYQRAGWFAPYEVEMLGSLEGRRRATAWAASRGGHAKEAMKRFQQEATHLALNRQRAALGTIPGASAQREEAKILATIAQARSIFMAGVR